MKFSIITITYNSEKYLGETMASVLSQDYGDFEYILVDGGSTDATLDIIRDHAGRDSRIRWISEPDEGIADAFNKGIRQAAGELVGIINSDDTYAPGALREVAVAHAAHPGCDVFHGDMLRFQGDTVLFRLVPADVATHIWREMPLNHPTVFVTRCAYGTVGGFDPTVRIAMDYDLMLRLYKSGCSFHYTGCVLANMRYGGASDAKHLEGLREVRAIAIREGCPRFNAWFWFGYKVAISTVKNMLRSFGLYRLLRLHPRFRAPGGQR